ncbi:2-C-methyl-D-erythritol 4-phosphate cytidylyltransferase [Glutamicibacter endophyticus]
MSTEQNSAAVILVAAGQGTRLGAGVPKALVKIHGTSLADHALARISQVSRVEHVVVVCPARDNRLARELDTCGVSVSFVDGGTSRAASVRAGLAAVPERFPNVLVHDAARAFTPPEVFNRVLDELEQGAAAVIPALEVTDTISETELGANQVRRIVRTPARANLRAVQTPQGFNAHLLSEAHAALGELSEPELEALTDDASVVANQGHPVHVVSGAPQSLKITRPEDLRGIEQLLGLSQERTMDQHPPIPRVGNGVDIHQVSTDPNRPMWLAGLHFPDDIGLAGHSDGDAVAHAACDALFAAAGIGDLGTHFGVDRPEFDGASGVSLLSEAGRLVRQAGFEIGNVSVQFVGRRPRFAARRLEANQVLSAALGASVDVSATTSDGLGYEGEGTGITAYATALVYPVPRN